MVIDAALFAEGEVVVLRFGFRARGVARRMGGTGEHPDDHRASGEEKEFPKHWSF